jgi:putative sugar O-methyltransferase
MWIQNIGMYFLEFFYTVLDLVPKLNFRLRRMFFGTRVFSSNSKSDSDSTPYGAFVDKAHNSKRCFKRFRRNYSYRVILEHVGYKQGKAYLEKITESTVKCYLQSPKLHHLNSIGSPRTYYFRRVGWMSPTILRYLFVNQHLVMLFGKSDITNIAEIGVGFGGQAAITIESINPKSFTLYDLPQVVRLGEKFLKEVGTDLSKIKCANIERLVSTEYDLVISNYAFSELPRDVQIDYVKSVLAPSKRGYLTMNSGRSDWTGRSAGKLTLDELRALLPGCEILEESPLTGPDNYIVIWGHNSVA